MNLPRENPSTPHLSVFLSYSIRDRAAVVPLIDALRAANVEVFDFFENEPFGADIDAWVEAQIAAADCMIVVVSDNALNSPQWIEREIGLAISLLADHGVLHPTIVPVQIGCGGHLEDAQFQPRNFRTGEPQGAPIVWKDVNCIMLERDGVDAAVARFVAALAPRTTLITDPDGRGQAELFDGAMRLYRQLLPTERERDREADIAHWLCESWDELGQPEQGAD